MATNLEGITLPDLRGHVLGQFQRSEKSLEERRAELKEAAERVVQGHPSLTSLRGRKPRVIEIRRLYDIDYRAIKSDRGLSDDQQNGRPAKLRALEAQFVAKVGVESAGGITDIDVLERQFCFRPRKNFVSSVTDHQRLSAIAADSAHVVPPIFIDQCEDALYSGDLGEVKRLRDLLASYPEYRSAYRDYRKQAQAVLDRMDYALLNEQDAVTDYAREYVKQLRIDWRWFIVNILNGKWDAMNDVAGAVATLNSNAA